MLRSFGMEPVKAAILNESVDAGAETFYRALGAGAGVIVPQLSRDTVEGLIAELDVQLCLRAKEPLTLIGFGFGAWLGLLYAVKYTDMVDRLVLIGCPPLELLPEIADPPAHDFRALRDLGMELRTDGSFPAVIERLPCVVRVLHGEYDPLPLDGVIKPLARGFATFETVLLYGCGHTPQRQEAAIAPLCELLWSIIYEQRV